jgi:2-iminobutanoate/2-iminopropanoate deaminase
MNRTFNPAGIAPPAPTGLFSHGVETPPNARWLHIAGQCGIRPDGSLPKDFDGQAEQTFANIVAVLADAGMGVKDLVKFTVYLTRQEDQVPLRRHRQAFLGEHRPAQTMVRIVGLAVPDWLIEIDAVAAKV